jgi:hypothetical protein
VSVPRKQQHVAQLSTGIAAPSAPTVTLPRFAATQTGVQYCTNTTQEAVPMEMEGRQEQGALDATAVTVPNVTVGLVAGEPEVAVGDGAGPSGLVTAGRPRR